MSDRAQPVDTSIDRSVAGTGILRITVAGTALFAVLGIGAAVVEGVVSGIYAVVALVEFFIGIVVFALAFFRAIDRSRTEAIGIGGLFFASGSAPRRVQVILVGSLTVQVVLSIAVASVHIYTALAFGVLAPMWALGFTGLWVAAHGTFPPRAPEPTRSGRRDAARRAHRRSASDGSRSDDDGARSGS